MAAPVSSPFLKSHSLPGCTNDEFGTRLEATLQNRLCQGLRDQPLDGMLHWTRSKLRAVALAHQQRIDRLIDGQPETLLTETRVQAGDELLGNLADVFLADSDSRST